METIIKKTLLAMALASGFSMSAEASTLVADGAWNAFDVDETSSVSSGLEWIDLNGNALSFDFSLAGSAYLKVVDGGFAGDRFNVFDNGVLLNQTSVASSTYPASIGLDFDAAYASPLYSQGLFWLSAGSHSITGLLSQSAISGSTPLNATVGAVSLTAVPVPAAFSLFLAGSSLLGFFSRRRANI